MILLKESLMESSGTMTPMTTKSGEPRAKGEQEQTGEATINYKGMQTEKDKFLSEQYKSGKFKEFNKLFTKEEDEGTNAGSKKKPEKKKEKIEYDENGNPIDGKHVDRSGERVKYKSLLRKRTR